MKKPKYLYHASENRNIDVLEPRMQSIRDLKEGPVLFATPSMALATCFIVNVDDTWADMGIVNGVTYFICSDEKRYKNADKGGVVYILDPEGFETSMDKGMGLDEWITKEKVVPISKVEYKSGLKSMEENGVKIFFVNENEFTQIMSNEDMIGDLLEK